MASSSQIITIENLTNPLPISLNTTVTPVQTQSFLPAGAKVYQACLVDTPGVAAANNFLSLFNPGASGKSLVPLGFVVDCHDVLATNIDAEFEREWSFGERMADRIASFGGSWTFLIWFGVFIALWIVMNSIVFLWRPADPYPFILLNLVLSCLAAIQAPIIMMSQNRQEAKDRLRSQHDYQVNLKAELEIRHLHQKLDHLLSHQWERLVEIQELQMELINEKRGGR